MKIIKKLSLSLLAVVICFTAVVGLTQIDANAEIVSTYDYYIYNNNGTTTEYAIPKVYTVKNVIRQFDDSNPTFSLPEDMFIDKYDNVYVCDTGNNRIVKLSKNGDVVLIVDKVAKEDGTKIVATNGKVTSEKFNGPMGIYIDDDQDIFVADTGNSRIVHLDSNGYCVEVFSQPKDTALESYPFDVTKIYINNRGLIYCLLKTDFQGLMVLNPDGTYNGNTGMTWTTSNLLSYIWSKLNPEAEKIERFTLSAPPYSNFMMDDNGWIYATVTATDDKQISKLNTSGTNVYGVSGDTEITQFGRDYSELTDTETYASATHYQSNFVDITVDKAGIVYALDDALGNVFVYDQTGNNIAFFGEKGSNRGKFKKPVSLNLFSDGSLAVLDKDTGYITVFKDTEFCRLMKQGVTYFFQADYSEARDVYEQLLKLDINYIYAHKAIAKAYYKEENYVTAMEEYKLAKDTTGYSLAFEKNKSAITKNYFFLIFGIVILAAILILVGLKRIKKYADKIHVKVTTWGGDL